MSRTSLLLIASLAMIGCASQYTTPEIGDKAPAFQAVDDQGNAWKSEEHVGRKNLILYFYPAAMTAGCTRQACAYRDSHEELTGVNAEVFGISGDDVEGLRIFKRAHGLPFTLLSDGDGSIARAFGVPVREGGTVRRAVDGEEHTLRRSATVARWTFIIDKEGRVVYTNTEVDAGTDAEKTIAFIRNLE